MARIKSYTEPIGGIHGLISGGTRSVIYDKDSDTKGVGYGKDEEESMNNARSAYIESDLEKKTKD
ncbi:hypothetical protein CMI43_00620 [Candidatus Pacearchaeota archaeon]|jgi:hypothetical protein|nr:hypothetical protein [Candidatus Pacearchaeota archaeon]|tara:strand:- start:1002 stop:1196 length:195 start_codon:yes stop_codon:yes gene_type:complete